MYIKGNILSIIRLLLHHSETTKSVENFCCSPDCLPAYTSHQNPKSVPPQSSAHDDVLAHTRSVIHRHNINFRSCRSTCTDTHTLACACFEHSGGIKLFPDTCYALKWYLHSPGQVKTSVRAGHRSYSHKSWARVDHVLHLIIVINCAACGANNFENYCGALW